MLFFSHSGGFGFSKGSDSCFRFLGSPLLVFLFILVLTGRDQLCHADGRAQMGFSRGEPLLFGLLSEVIQRQKDRVNRISAFRVQLGCLLSVGVKNLCLEPTLGGTYSNESSWFSSFVTAGRRTFFPLAKWSKESFWREKTHTHCWWKKR